MSQPPPPRQQTHGPHRSMVSIDQGGMDRSALQMSSNSYSPSPHNQRSPSIMQAPEKSLGAPINPDNLSKAEKKGWLSKFLTRRVDKDALKSQGILKEEGLFGQPISFIVHEHGKHGVPHIVRTCAKFLKQDHVLREPGLFRISGDKLEVDELKRAFEKGKVNLELNGTAIHAVTGVLKLFIRELPEPLFTFKLYAPMLAAWREVPPNHNKILDMMATLPKPNQYTWKYLLNFFVRVVALSDVNMMTAKNLGIVLAPNVLKPEVDNMATMGADARDTPNIVAMIIENSINNPSNKTIEYKMKKESSNASGLMRGPSPSGGPPSLPSAWTAQRDPSTGNTFYQNSITGETTWNKPAEMQMQAPTLKPPSGPPPLLKTNSVSNVTAQSPSSLPPPMLRQQTASPATHGGLANPSRAAHLGPPPMSPPSSAPGPNSNGLPPKQPQAPQSMGGRPGASMGPPGNVPPRLGPPTLPPPSQQQQQQHQQQMQPPQSLPPAMKAPSSIPPSSMPVPATNPWVAHLDPNSGLVFYRNTVTEVVTWDEPAEFKKLTASVSPPSSNPAQTSNSGDHGWVAHVDPSTSNTFYQNTKTGVVQWDTPAELATPETAAAANSPWKKHMDPSSGNFFFQNAITQETTWDPPPEFR